MKSYSRGKASLNSFRTKTLSPFTNANTQAAVNCSDSHSLKADFTAKTSTERLKCFGKTTQRMMATLLLPLMNQAMMPSIGDVRIVNPDMKKEKWTKRELSIGVSLLVARLFHPLFFLHIKNYF